MPFVSPMLARPMKPDFSLEAGEYAAEEKVDGHRLVCEVSSEGQTNLFLDKQITAWSRYGLERVLPHHLLESLSRLPDGIYDGELLVPGSRSYGVTELVNLEYLHFYIFDLIKLGHTDMTPASYSVRRDHLVEMHLRNLMNAPVKLLPSRIVNTWDEVIKLRDEVWARDGEGLILKRVSSPYLVGKRSKDLVKIKALRSATLTVIGFIPSKGQINNRGPYATILLRDDDGNETTVKTRNDAECQKLEAEAGPIPHPAIGRKLVIEYQERTPDGNYRHPRFDHWA